LVSDLASTVSSSEKKESVEESSEKSDIESGDNAPPSPPKAKLTTIASKQAQALKIPLKTYEVPD
jgi:hypothetical protein